MKVKTKRRICGIISAVALLLMIGIGGSVDLGYIPLAGGAVIISISEVVCVFSAYKGGYMR